MITALDTNVLLDVFTNAARHAEASRTAAESAAAEGGLVICEIVFAELARAFQRLSDLKGTLARLDIRMEPVGEEGCFLAGQAFNRYRASGGKRDRVLADFLIAGHAQTRCARLLSRDRGFYRTYFPALPVWDPSA